MISSGATGPWAIDCGRPSSVVAACRVEVRRHPLPDQQKDADERDREEDPQDGADEVHPEVPDARRFRPDETPQEGDADGEARRAGEKVLRREPDHLAEIAHRGLAAVGLPGRRGREADRRVEGEVRRHGSREERGVVPRKQRLRAQEPVEEKRPEQAEQEKSDAVLTRHHVVSRIDAENTVDAALDGAEQPIRKSPSLPGRRASVSAERLDEEGDAKQERGVLQKIGKVHGPASVRPRGDPIEREVQSEHVDARLTEEEPLSRLRVDGDEPPDFFESQSGGRAPRGGPARRHSRG